MAEPTSAISAALPTASALLFGAMLPGVDGGALIGAFAGAALFIVHNNELGVSKRLVYGLVSWLIGYFAAPELGRLVGVQETVVTGFGAAAVAVTVAITAIKKIEAADFTFWKRGG
ncbi:putative holin [Achromobacter sp. DH1f]|uniref:putative holin n=1 Tax=Achromobacter sp. DH1f TaxID=1397275 RepID=UPI00046824B2|nr:putative holin [Achromobacter sp. DH1f]